MRATIGFIGTGILTEAVVGALVEKYGDSLPIVVSPRSRTTAHTLAQKFRSVSVADSNADVVAASETVFLATRPQQIDAALHNISFRPGQTVVSFVAKMTLPEIRERVAPAQTVCRVTPLPAIAYRKGPVVVFPCVEAVADLFAGLGTVIVVTSEEEAMALGDAAGLMSTYFELQSSITSWLAGHGADHDRAALYTRTMFEALAATAMHTPQSEQSLLVARHETLGGLNERCRQTLLGASWFDEMRRALDVLNRQTSLRDNALQASPP